jgi:D-alanyl-lipoteichoic acid acyltransferase DltB (MBOAT superfamily)
MQFDSATFLLFFALVFVAYHLLAASVRLQNVLICVASFVFYAWFDWRLSFLLLAYAAVAFGFALWIERARSERTKSRLLAVAVTLNLTGLGFFKYFDFFRRNVVAALGALGIETGWTFVQVVLPIGISFYAFQKIAYLVDVRQGKVRAERDPVTFFAFISFFCQLVAGPIERAGHLLPQFRKPRRVTQAHVSVGLWLFVWGMFLKVVASNTVAGYANVAFAPSPYTDALTVLEGTLAFTLQIYFDFNAYSLIAKGTAALLGFELVWNFDRPYFATSIQDFWRRWHISLSTWLRDYLYIPLGGNRRGEGRTYVNLMITMGLGGLWHGASWTFVLWGVLHGVALSVHRLYRTRLDGPPWPAPLGWLATMLVVVPGWFLFRSGSLENATALLSHLGHLSWKPFDEAAWLAMLAVATPVFFLEWLQIRTNDVLVATRLAFVPYSVVVSALLLAIFARFYGTQHEFIYFQF